MRVLPIAVLSLFFLHFVDGYKILVFSSKFSHSHANFLGQIADTLVDAGHNVTTVLAEMDPHVRDGTEKSNKIHMEADPSVKALHEDPEIQKKVNFFESNVANPIGPLIIGPMFAYTFYYNCKKLMDEPGLIGRLRDEQFHVIIAENFEFCGVGISKAIAPKALIGVASTTVFGLQHDEWGVPTAESYRPTSIVSSLDVHSFSSRLFNYYGSLVDRIMFWFPRWAINRALKEKFGPDYPTVGEISANVAYVFTNAEPLIEAAAPTTSRVIDIGGIGAKQSKPLDEYWEGILTLRPKTILISFGTIAKSMYMPQEMKTGLIKAIARFPDVTFIWKYEEPEDEFGKGEAATAPNLILSKWMPQVDILAHPNLAAFITHGGMGSLHETAIRGVPGIFIPLFADQPRNAGVMEFNGFGRVYDKNDLPHVDKLTKTIEDVLNNETYRQNAKRISAMLARKPFTARELLIKHVEFAAEFGASAALRPQSLDMNFIEYNNLDIIACGLIVSAIFAYISTKFLMCTVRKMARVVKQKKE
ncbi:hypothetical protein PRIPAC_81123 [Pristionchus pacificus]|uniref:glucuronosyltransferase n=1 Tax=Pristionchus pacificus TaxID=54126 RepID=A0A2A6CJ98_PRIPA|nr:hypothetical protein PRIPAC_81123 [Pristionchus pacificus]|eukprot:PDM78158.1 Glycosyltransferase [Pristionchus pacificus]